MQQTRVFFSHCTNPFDSSWLALRGLLPSRAGEAVLPSAVHHRAASMYTSFGAIRDTVCALQREVADRSSQVHPFRRTVLTW